MTKIWVAFVSVMLLLGTPAIAASWTDGFNTVDTDGSGTISRAEWDANESKVGDPTFNPTFQTMDSNGNNSVDEDEWAAAEGMKTAIGNSCQSAEGSWCPCQNHPEKPECQKSN
ncbi:EF-hand domain-containing protein [Methyloceanibacter superfactus]|jgi:EF hand domain-containing protein|nr:EF-hand domain-containing protein [Methyloceanibacter superfactus]